MIPSFLEKYWQFIMKSFCCPRCSILVPKVIAVLKEFFVLELNKINSITVLQHFKHILVIHDWHDNLPTTGTRNLKQHDICVKVKFRWDHQYKIKNWSMFTLVPLAAHSNPFGKWVMSYRFHARLFEKFSWNCGKWFHISQNYCKEARTKSRLDFC